MKRLWICGLLCLTVSACGGASRSASPYTPFTPESPFEERVATSGASVVFKQFDLTSNRFLYGHDVVAYGGREFLTIGSQTVDVVFLNGSEVGDYGYPTLSPYTEPGGPGSADSIAAYNGYIYNPAEYIASGYQNNGAIVRYDPAHGIEMAHLTKPELANPNGRIAFDRSGRLWLAAGYNNETYVAAISNPGTSVQAITERIVGGSGNLYDNPYGFVLGPDGNIWAVGTTEIPPGPGYTIDLYRFNSDLSVAQRYVLDTSSSCCDYELTSDITVGPDNAFWITASSYNVNAVYRATMSGSVHKYTVPTPNAGLTRIATGGDGALWFTEYTAKKVGRIATSGSISEYNVPIAGASPYGVTGPLAGTHPGYDVWVTLQGAHTLLQISP